MQALKHIQSPLAQQPLSANLSVMKRSAKLSATDLAFLAVLFADMQARFPNQTILKTTVQAYMHDWEEMVLKFGMDCFQEALSKVSQTTEFFPHPAEIRSVCQDLKRSARQDNDAQRYLQELAEWQKRWEFENRDEWTNRPWVKSHKEVEEETKTAEEEARIAARVQAAKAGGRLP